MSDTDILGVKELIQNALSLSLHMGSSILAYALLTSPIGDTCTCKTVKLVESASYCVLKLLTTVPNPNWELWFAFFSKNMKFIFNNNKNKQRRKLWVSCNNHSGYLVVKPFLVNCAYFMNVTQKQQ